MAAAQAIASAQTPSVTDAELGRAAAQDDAKGKGASQAGWIVFGFFVPIVAPVVVYALPAPEPPALRLVGKTTEYTTAYVEEWKRHSKGRRVKRTWIGAGLGGALMVVGLAVLANDDPFR